VARRKHRDNLTRAIGVPGLFSTAYGNVGSSIYYALGVVAAFALGLTPVVVLVTGLLFVMTAWSYSEATAMLPEAGGASSFARRAFNEFVSFGAGWALMLDYIITIAISAFFVPLYLASFWPILKVWPYNTLVGIGTIMVLVVVNIMGIKETARLNSVLAVLVLATQVALVIIGFILLFKPKILIDQIHLGVSPTWGQLLYAIPLGTVAYTGIETVSNMAEEASDPGRDVPRAVNLVLVAVVLVFTALSLVALSALPVKSNVLRVDQATGRTVETPIEKQSSGSFVLSSDHRTIVYVPVEKKADGWVIPALKPTGKVFQQNGTKVTRLYGSELGGAYLENPISGLVLRLGNAHSLLIRGLNAWVSLLAVFILIIATNAGLIGSSRLTYALAQHRQIPPFLGRVHTTRMTPYIAIALFGVIASLLIGPGDIKLLADLYAFGAMISFTVAHVSVIALRYREPDTARPFRTPFNIRFRGGSLPLLAVIGGLGTGAVWMAVVLTHPKGRYIGLAWMAVGIAMYVVYRRHKGYSLTKGVPRPAPLPLAAAADIDYDQILVPIVGSRVTDEMMVLACQLATEKQSSVDALYVIEVPMNLPLDARLVKERARAQHVLSVAATIAGQFGVEMRPHVITARQAGKAIVAEAKERKAEVIIIGSVRKRRIGERLFGPTVTYVLEHSPCEVIHNLVPEGYPMAGSAGGLIPLDDEAESLDEPEGILHVTKD
jgi:basic amino acid/polyamine antiporter, APA family